MKDITAACQRRLRRPAAVLLLTAGYFRALATPIQGGGVVLIQQVGVDLAGGGGVEWPRALPMSNRGRALGGGHGGEGVPQAVEGDLGQVIGPDEPGEGQGQPRWGSRDSPWRPPPPCRCPARRPPGPACARPAGPAPGGAGGTAPRSGGGCGWRRSLGLLWTISAPAAVRASLMWSLRSSRSTLLHRRPQISSRRRPKAARQLDDQLQPVALHQPEEPLEAPRAVEPGLLGNDREAPPALWGSGGDVLRTATWRAQESRSWWRRTVLAVRPLSRMSMV